MAVFEATHGTAPKYANQDVINPGSLILSGVMMLRHMKWNEAADAIERGLAKTIAQKKVTYDLERQMQGATKVKTSEFAKYIVEKGGNLPAPASRLSGRRSTKPRPMDEASTPFPTASSRSERSRTFAIPSKT